MPDFLKMCQLIIRYSYFIAKLSNIRYSDFSQEIKEIRHIKRHSAMTALAKSASSHFRKIEKGQLACLVFIFIYERTIP